MTKDFIRVLALLIERPLTCNLGAQCKASSQSSSKVCELQGWVDSRDQLSYKPRTVLQRFQLNASLQWYVVGRTVTNHET